MNGLAAALLAGLLVSTNVHGTQLFTLQDPAITESSGLVDLGSLMVTMNDSGGGPLVYVLDPHTGRTVATTTYADHGVTDTEALSPDDAHHIWVGDIGDNFVDRSSVQVYRVPVAGYSQRVQAPRYDLVYPDGPHDAESLVYGPDGRLRIITKSILGGRVYVAPKALDPYGPNKLTAGPPVALYATDAALLPDRKHVLVRGYGGAIVTTFPGFRTIASFGLPSQQQGEGVSVGPNGRIRLSSEGEHSPVLQISLPAAVERLLHPGDAHAAIPITPDTASSVDDGSDSLDWVLVVGVVALGVVVIVVRRRRR